MSGKNTSMLIGPGEVLNVKSPLSPSIIISYDGNTKQTQRGLCEECLGVVQGRIPLLRKVDNQFMDPFWENGVGDPIYFLGAQVPFSTLVIPAYGRVAWETGNEESKNMVRFLISNLPKRVRKNWNYETGTPFPHWLYKR